MGCYFFEEISLTLIGLSLNILTDLITYDPAPDGSQADYLFHHVKFYRGLSEKGKRKFLRRTKRFIANKDFEFFLDSSKDELLIKTLVASSCIQVTWGLDDTYLDSYSYIGIHRNGIQLKKSRSKSLNALWLKSRGKGSWNNTQEGQFFMGNGRQVGLMEWTSVFIIEAKNDNVLDDFFSAYYKVWCEAARDIMFVVDEEDQLPLNAFGKKLPIIIQHFFEEPEELKRNHPEIYEHTKILLNLDLLEAAEYDFVYAEKIKKEKKIKSSNRALIFSVQDKVRKFALPAGIMYLILIQVPVVISIWFLMGRWTYFSWTFWEIFFVLSFISIFLVHRFYYVKRGLAAYASVVLFIMGFIPFIYSSMHLLNYTVPITRYSQTMPVAKLSELENNLPWFGFTKPHISKILVTEPKYETNEQTGEVTRTDIVVDTFTDQTHIRSAISLFDKNDEVQMHTYKGLFGATVFHGYVIVLKK